jgi:hypothetical protein
VEKLNFQIMMRIRRSAKYDEMGIVKGANTHHDKATECESEKVKSLNMYTNELSLQV